MNTKTFLMGAALICGAQLMTAQTENQPAPEAKRPTQEQMLQMMATETANDLMLNEATAAKFIPIYENYIKAMGELNPKCPDEKPCFGQGPDGRMDGPKADKGKGGKKGPKHDGKGAPAPGDQPAPGNQPAPGDQPAPDGKACPNNGGEPKAPQVMTDSEAEQMIKDRVERLRKEADIQEKYYKELKGILTPQQIVKAMSFGIRGPQGPKGQQGPRK